MTKFLLLLAFIPIMVIAQEGAVTTGGEAASSRANQSVAAQSAEMVILVDNSAAMQALAVDGGLASALTGFITDNTDLVDISVMTFADDVTIISSLADDSLDDPAVLTDALLAIDFDGDSRDMTRALERAVYELEYNGRTDIPKSIVAIMAGTVAGEGPGSVVVPPGLAEGDIELFTIRGGDDQPSAETGLPPESVTAGFTLNNLDGLQPILMQIVGRTTEGSRATGNAVAGNPSPVTSQAPAAVVSQAPSATNTIPAITPTTLVGEDRTRSIILLVTALLLTLTLGALIVLLFLRSRKSGIRPDIAVTEACLRDIHGYTSSESFHLGEKATMLGRVAGKDSSSIDYIVIPEPTIGRRHAVIEYKDFGYWITDQGSINGTFVNDVPISSEIRLKHGDIVRLHKYEFQFVVPELEESPATRVSDTVMAGHTPAAGSGQDELMSGTDKAGIELNINISGDATAEQEASPPPSGDDETLLPGHDMEPPAGDESPGSEVTLLPDTAAPDGNAVEDSAVTPVPEHKEETAEDETLIPGQFDDSGDDATIRPNQETGDDEIFDITGGDEDKSR